MFFFFKGVIPLCVQLLGCTEHYCTFVLFLILQCGSLEANMAQLFSEPACIPHFKSLQLGKFKKCSSQQKARKVSSDCVFCLLVYLWEMSVTGDWQCLPTTKCCTAMFLNLPCTNFPSNTSGFMAF